MVWPTRISPRSNEVHSHLAFIDFCFNFHLAKEEKAKEPEIVKEDAAASGKDEAVAEPLTDGSGAKTEGGSSDFDIEQLLKLIDALKNQDFDEVDRNFEG